MWRSILAFLQLCFGSIRSLGGVWYMHLKTENCSLKIENCYLKTLTKHPLRIQRMQKSSI